jgi:hypothetical protein
MLRQFEEILMKSRWIVGIALLALLPLLPSACGEPEKYLMYGIDISCSEFEDCYRKSTDLLGAMCIDEICQCPTDPEFAYMYRFPCRKKGSHPGDCYRLCQALEDCDPSDVNPKYLPPGTPWPPADGSGGAGGSGGASAASSATEE